MVIFGGDRDSTLNLTNELWGLRLDNTPGWSLMVPTGTKPAPGQRMGAFMTRYTSASSFTGDSIPASRHSMMSGW